MSLAGLSPPGKGEGEQPAGHSRLTYVCTLHFLVKKYDGWRGRDVRLPTGHTHPIKQRNASSDFGWNTKISLIIHQANSMTILLFQS